jgi:hypothetical protein
VLAVSIQATSGLSTILAKRKEEIAELNEELEDLRQQEQLLQPNPQTKSNL